MHEVTGCLVEPGNVDEMARCSVKILSDSKKYSEMSQRGIECAKEHFCASKIVPQYLAYYEKVLLSTFAK